MRQISKSYRKKTNCEFIRKGDFDIVLSGGTFINNLFLFGKDFSINCFGNNSVYFYGKDKFPYKEGDLFFKSFYSRVKE